MHHAWLIIAHNEFGILQRLVTALDAPQCDFFLHIDRKVSDLPDLQVKHGRMHVLDERVDVRWGSVSQIECELTLLEAARKEGPFDFYHIISGTTLPLMPWEAIDAFFSGNQGRCILTPVHKDQPYQETLKIHRRNFFLRNYATKGLKGRFSQYAWRAGIAVQRLLGMEINREKDFFKASNWLSITQKAVEFLLARKEEILKTYRYSFCGDEYFIPSELMASPLRDAIMNCDHYLKCDIPRSTSGVFHLEDLPELERTGYLFARKFTER